MEPTSFRAGVSLAEFQRLSRRTFSPITSSNLRSYNRSYVRVFPWSAVRKGFSSLGCPKRTDDCGGTLGRRSGTKHAIDPALGRRCRAAGHDHQALLRPASAYIRSIFLVRSCGNWNLDSLLQLSCMAHFGTCFCGKRTYAAGHITSAVVKKLLLQPRFVLLPIGVHNPTLLFCRQFSDAKPFCRILRIFRPKLKRPYNPASLPRHIFAVFLGCREPFLVLQVARGNARAPISLCRTR